MLQTIRECFNDDACVGSTDVITSGVVGERDLSVDDYCATGYMGPCKFVLLLLLLLW